MSRQYFMDTIQEPVLADLLTYATVTTEALLWPVAINTPINANDARPGKMYKVTAGGIITLPANTGSITLTPRVGLTVTSSSIGASGALFSPGATTNRPWRLELDVLCRAVSATAGANSTFIGWGQFITQGLLTTGSAPFVLTLGGTSVATVDVGIATGIGVSIIWGTTAGSITTQWAAIQSWN
jgi:hypothetical protein